MIDSRRCRAVILRSCCSIGRVAMLTRYQSITTLRVIIRLQLGGTMRRTPPLWLVIIATGVPVFMATLDNLVVTTALPVIHRELGAGIDALQWITNAYTLAFAALMLFAVGLGDRFG